MAGSSLFALIDDIATILDDVSLMTKVAAQKTAGVLGDDLALNAQQVAGVSPDRELPVVWAVAKGSFVNKLILVPSALAISAFAPWLVTPLLMFGGLFLCFEGVEKLAHKYLHDSEEQKQHHDALLAALADPQVDLVAFEKEKISGAVRTDFVLSAEIITITLGTVATATFGMQVAVLSGIAILMTVGVYGLVAAIVKLDDLGLLLLKKQTKTLVGKSRKAIGESILWFAPWLMRFLSVAGTIAMFLVGGGIIVHGVPMLNHLVEKLSQIDENSSLVSSIWQWLASPLAGLFVGLLSGALALLVFSVAKKIYLRFGTRSIKNVD